MKTQYYTAASLDGFIADPAHSLDWLLQFPMTDDYPDFIRDVGAVAMGATTYEWVRADLARSGSPWPYDQPAWVFTSRELPPIPGADVRFVRGDVRPVHEQMVAEAGGKNVWLVGGGDLVGQFCDSGLVDELIVTVAPVTLGGGAPLLPRAITAPPLRLVSAQVLSDTFVQLRYEVPRERAAPSVRADATSAPLPPGLGKPALRALAAAGITTLDGVAALSEADLLAMHGVGPKVVRRLLAALADGGGLIPPDAA